MVHSHDPGALVADAGCILEALTEHIAPHDHIMPLDLGAKGRYTHTRSFSRTRILMQFQLSDRWEHLDERGWTSSSTIRLLAWERAWPRSCAAGWNYLG